MNVLQLGLFTSTTVVSTTIDHIINRKSFKNTPHAEYSYHQGFSLLRGFLEFSRGMTVEELQGMTSQPIAVPAGVHREDFEIPENHIKNAAKHLEAELGEHGIAEVGGRKWWQWREDKLKAEWVETSWQREARKKGDVEDTALLYIHGGAFYFNSPATARFQSIAFAKKIGTRVLAVDYRLAPQYPFPCGLHDAVASYLYLLETYSPKNILLCGDSAGGNLCLALMVLLRNQGLPLPAGGILLSPWVDLTHSFPSCAEDCKMDYIPHTGFQHKPSIAWPPPAYTEEGIELKEKLEKLANGEETETELVAEQEDDTKTGPLPKSVKVHLKDGKGMEVKEQIHMYATNDLVQHPLVSLVNQGSLGGLPPLLITTGSAEKLHDEHLYLAHKAANPSKYPANDEILEKFPEMAKDADKWGPTDVKLQNFEGCCHVVTTLSFSKPAKLCFRSLATFGKYALARANGREIEHTISSLNVKDKNMTSHGIFSVGKFENHMIRERVTCRGEIIPMEPESEIPALQLPKNDIGVIKPDALHLWLEAKSEMEKKYAKARKHLQNKLNSENVKARADIEPGENPPPAAIYRRRKRESAVEARPSSAQSNMPSQLWNTATEPEPAEEKDEEEGVESKNRESKL